ncbi:MAG TPA: DUF1801 domain-containing protein [Candidatus Acidoferrales bacterium]|nr:DUF1801 domain-containing protein [Candidatus Acidoferrales bacterium]
MAKTSKPKESEKSPTVKKSNGFSEEERAAMRERVQEMNSNAGESDVLAKIAAMPEPDRSMAKRLHAIIKSCAPELTSKTWYGMPAYVKGDNIVCFFQNAGKFKARYSTLGFSDKANLDEGSMWPTTYALMKLTATEEARIRTLVKKAIS